MTIKLKSLLKENGSASSIKKEIEAFRQTLLDEYPQIQDLFLHGTSQPDVLHIAQIRIKPEFRKQGIGSEIIRKIKKFADDHKLTITLSPEPQYGYKKKLDKFYQKHGFIHNRGRRKDYRLSSFFGRNMIRRPDINEGMCLLMPHKPTISESDTVMVSLLTLLIESRVSDFKEKYETLPDEIKDRLIQNDPSSNYKYLDWMGRVATAEPDVKVDDLVKDVNEFDKFRATLGDIYKLKGYNDLKYALSSRQKSKKETTKEGAEVLIDNDEFLVVAPTTHDSCRYFGNNTRWCITGTESWWNKYYYESTIIIVLDKRNNEKYAVIGRPDYGEDVYDSQDHTLSYSAFQGDEDDSWPEYVHDAISEYMSNDDVESRKTKWHEKLIDVFVKEYGLNKVWENYLEAIHSEAGIEEQTSLESFKEIANYNGITDETLARWATSYLYYKLQEGTEEGIEDDIGILGDLDNRASLESALRDMGEYEWNDKTPGGVSGNKTVLEETAADYIHSIKGIDKYLQIIENAIGTQAYENLPTIADDLFNAVVKYNNILDDPRQQALKGMEVGRQSVRITNIRDIIHVFKRTGYEHIGHHLESLLGIVVEEEGMIKLSPMLKEERTSTVDKGCLMANILKPYQKMLVDFGKQLVKDDDLYIVGDEYGREKETHVTILYGFVPELNELQIRKILQGVEPFTITLTGIDTFKNEEEGFDVVKFTVESSVLRQLNERAKKYPNQNDFPNYSPHLTIAYVKPGTFKTPISRLKINIPVHQVFYSTANTDKSYFDL